MPTTLDIIEYPHPVLRQTAARITDFDSALKVLIDDLTLTLYSTTGIGLSAPQVAQSLQIMVMDLSDDHSQAEVLINPQIMRKSGLAIVEESCLSIPGVAAKVMRSNTISVKAMDMNGQAIERQYDGMHAVCVQHEIDHLHGILFIDRISKLRRYRFRHTLQSLEKSVA